MALTSHFGTAMLMEVYTRTTHSVVLISVRRLLRCSILPFQAGNLSMIRSSSGWRTDLGTLLVDKGIPRYLMGKSTF
jgi:hypothetical protein